MGLGALVPAMLAALHLAGLPQDATQGTNDVPPLDSLRALATSAPLFASHEPLLLAMEGPLHTIFEQRGAESEESPVRLTETSPGGASWEVDVRTRGNARLRKDVCEFPPLRLDFDREDVEGSVFHGQNRLKLVVHCQSGREEYEQYVRQEYLVYRMQNLLTDLSFKVRPAMITYTDSDGERDTITRPAFLIEDDEMMAARNGWRLVDAPTVSPSSVDPAYLAFTGVFQYMIGNPDWSAFAAAPGEGECCHNTRPVGNPSTGPVFPVAYDFDITGLVGTRYADRLFNPAERNIGIRSVRDRVYRGLCSSASHLPAVFALFNEKREAIYALYRAEPGLDPEVLEESIEYLDGFYETINDPRRTEREITRACRRG